MQYIVSYTVTVKFIFFIKMALFCLTANGGWSISANERTNRYSPYKNDCTRHIVYEPKRLTGVCMLQMFVLSFVVCLARRRRSSIEGEVSRDDLDSDEDEAAARA